MVSMPSFGARPENGRFRGYAKLSRRKTLRKKGARRTIFFLTNVSHIGFRFSPE
jgi:hypothetical protein